MAIHSKKIQHGSSNNMVSFTGTIGATDLQLTLNDGSTWDPAFTRIEAVYNFSGGNVSFGGFTFAAGTHDFGVAGGLHLATPQTGAIAGNANCLITLRT